jgi:type II secretory pathway pseudopilin PulG
MGITPIDLQTLFAQMDKVAKTQVSQKEGQVIQQAIQNVQLQKKAEEDVEQVNQAQNMGEGTEKVKDRGAEHKQGEGNKKGRSGGGEQGEEEQASVLSDPSLGKKIDISL